MTQNDRTEITQLLISHNEHVDESLNLINTKLQVMSDRITRVETLLTVQPPIPPSTQVDLLDFRLTGNAKATQLVKLVLLVASLLGIGGGITALSNTQPQPTEERQVNAQPNQPPPPQPQPQP